MIKQYLCAHFYWSAQNTLLVKSKRPSFDFAMMSAVVVQGIGCGCAYTATDKSVNSTLAMQVYSS